MKQSLKHLARIAIIYLHTTRYNLRKILPHVKQKGKFGLNGQAQRHILRLKMVQQNYAKRPQRWSINERECIEGELSDCQRPAYVAALKLNPAQPPNNYQKQ